MDKISQHINTKNYKIRSYDQMRRMTVNLSSKKGGINDDSYPKLPDLHNSLLMSIVTGPGRSTGD